MGSAVRRGYLFVVRHLVKNQRGQTALEYFLLAGAVAILVGVAAFTFGGKVGQAVVTGQKCITDVTSAANGATATTFTGTGVCA